MAWTESCKLDANKQVQHLKKKGMSVRQAIKKLSDESGIPENTINNWIYQSGVPKGSPYGEKYFYKWWKRAAGNLGINDVDLYGGTRHSTVQHLRDQGFTPEELRMASGHATSRAFTRYFGRSPNYFRRIYAGKPGDED